MTQATLSRSSQRFRWMLAICLDALGVALVVPLLPFYYKDLGIDVALYGRIGAVYSLSQIVGGVLMGYLADRRLGRRAIFLLSLLGTGASYAMVAHARSVPFLVASRVLVGLVKQTMTVGNSLMTTLSAPEERAAVMGQLTAMMRIGWLGGQALGGFLSERSGSRKLPAIIATSLFVLDVLLVLFFLPSDGTDKDAKKEDEAQAKDKSCQPNGRETVKSRPSGMLGRVWSPFVATFSSAMNLVRSNPALAGVLAIRLVYFFVRSSIRSMGAFYEQERFGIDPEWAGYISAFRGFVDIALQGVFLGRLVRTLGERTTLVTALSVTAACSAVQASPALVGRWTYALVLSPLMTVMSSVCHTCMSSLYSKVIPTSDAGSAFGAFNVFRSVVGVAAPLYGAFMLEQFGSTLQPLLSGLHLTLVTGLVIVVLPSAAALEARSPGEPKKTTKTE